MLGSRVLPVAFATCALLADTAGLHRVAFYLVLVAIPLAVAAACVGVGDALEGKGAWMRGISTTVALTLLVVGCAVREGAPQGAAVPAFAVSAIAAALIAYALPGLAWVLEPLRVRPRVRPAAPARLS
jgi:hypothetical protein